MQDAGGLKAEWLEINPFKTEGIRELGPVDISHLKATLRTVDETEWDREEDFNLNYNKKLSLRDTNHIVFRFTNKRSVPFRYLADARWKVWKSLVLPVLEQAVKPYEYKNGYFTKVMLARMMPGKLIAPHQDGDATGHVAHKIHIPVITNPDAFFYLVPKKYQFQEGFAYEVNNGAVHAAANNGATPRIHLLCEYLDMDVQPPHIREAMMAEMDA